MFSGYIKNFDEKPSATTWGKKMSFAELMGEFGTGIGGGAFTRNIAFEYQVYVKKLLRCVVVYWLHFDIFKSV